MNRYPALRTELPDFKGWGAENPANAAFDALEEMIAVMAWRERQCKAHPFVFETLGNLFRAEVRLEVVVARAV